jgi:hypothetical protein
MKYTLIMIFAISILLAGCGGGMDYCGDGICSYGEECAADCGNDNVTYEESPETEPIEEETNATIEPEDTGMDERQAEETEEDMFVITAEPADYDLKDYPDMFSGDTIIIVGNEAPASDVVSATYIQNSVGGKVKSVLASEINDISGKNIISVGNACNNRITAEIIGNPKDCLSGLEEGVGRAAIYKNGDKISMVIDGYSSVDVRRAAKLLEEQPDRLSGSISCIYGSALDVDKVTNC